MGVKSRRKREIRRLVERDDASARIALNMHRNHAFFRVIRGWTRAEDEPALAIGREGWPERTGRQHG